MNTRFSFLFLIIVTFSAQVSFSQEYEIASDCQDTMDLNTYDTSTTFWSKVKTFVNGIISGNKLIQVLSGNEIILNPGFEVKSSSRFTATISNCSNALKENVSPISLASINIFTWDYGNPYAISINNNSNAAIAWTQDEQYTYNDNTFVYHKGYNKWSGPAKVFFQDSDYSRLVNTTVTMLDDNNYIISGRHKGRLRIIQYDNGEIIYSNNPSLFTPYQIIYHSISSNIHNDAIIAYYSSCGIHRFQYRNGLWENNNMAEQRIDVLSNIKCAYYTSHTNVAMDNNGNAAIIYVLKEDSQNSPFRIYLHEYRHGSWNDPSELEHYFGPSFVEPVADQPDIGMADNGYAVAACVQFDSSQDRQIFISEYIDESWDHPENLSDNISIDGIDATRPQVEVSSCGNALVVWEQYNYYSTSTDNIKKIYMSTYIDGVWDHPESPNDYISFPFSDATYPDIAMKNKAAAIVWHQEDPIGVSRIYMSKYDGSNWKHPNNYEDYISLNIDNDAIFPKVDLDGKGNATVIWAQIGTSGYWHLYKYEEKPGPLKPSPGDPVIYPEIAPSRSEGGYENPMGGLYGCWRNPKEVEDQNCYQVFDGKTYTLKHGGIDIAGAIGDSVYAMYGGTVILSDNKCDNQNNYCNTGNRGTCTSNLGNQITIRTYNGDEYFDITYGHLQSTAIDVCPSEEICVETGEVIGYIGKTGNACSPWINSHVHIQVKENGSTVVSNIQKYMSTKFKECMIMIEGDLCWE